MQVRSLVRDLSISHAAGQLSLHTATKTRCSKRKKKKGEGWQETWERRRRESIWQWLRPHSWKGIRKLMCGCFTALPWKDRTQNHWWVSWFHWPSPQSPSESLSKNWLWLLCPDNFIIRRDHLHTPHTQAGSLEMQLVAFQKIWVPTYFRYLFGSRNMNIKIFYNDMIRYLGMHPNSSSLFLEQYITF